MHMVVFALWQSGHGFTDKFVLAYVVAHISQTLAGRLGRPPDGPRTLGFNLIDCFLEIWCPSFLHTLGCGG